MTKRTSFLTRCLSMLLVLALLLSNVNMGFVVRASAAEVKTTVGDVIAKNYALGNELTTLVKTYLTNGDQEVAYNAFEGKDLVAVENGTITAKAEGNWKPVNAKLVKDGQTLTETALVAGENGTYTGTYTTAETMFSAEVLYVLDAELPVDAAAIQNMLDAAAELNGGVKDIEAMQKSIDASTLSNAATALPELQKLVDNGIITSSAAAITALNGELSNGMLPLHSTFVNYASYTGSKVSYLVNGGETYRQQYLSTLANLAAIAADPFVMGENFLNTVKLIYGENVAEIIDNFRSNLVAQVEAMDVVAKHLPGAWNTSALKTGLVEADYQVIDTLVAGQESLGVTVSSNVARIDNAIATATMNMKLVNLTVKMTVIADNAETALTDYTAVLALPNETAAAGVLAVINENVTAAVAGWGNTDVLNHFDRTESTLPEVLTEDISYTVTFAPKTYNVTKTGIAVDIADSYAYGTVVTLPTSKIDSKANRYTVSVNGGEGVKYNEGSKLTITGDTAIFVEEVKAYEKFDLYQVIAGTVDNEIAADILTAGALSGNVNYRVQMPDPTNDASLLNLEDGILTAETYDADWNGWVWVPYSYGPTGTENLFNGKTEVECADKKVSVIYALMLQDCTADKYVEILTTAKEVKDEANSQLAGLNSLNGYYGNLEMITPTILDVLISNVNRTDFSKVGGNNATMRKVFNDVLEGMKANCLNVAQTRLTLVDLIEDIHNYLGNADSAAALNAYYTKDQKVINEVVRLSDYLNQMLPDAEYDLYLKGLGAIIETAKSDAMLADKIPADINEMLPKLKDGMNGVRANLCVKNAAIETATPELLKALTAEGTFEVPTTGMVPYKQTLEFTATSSDFAYVTIEIWKNGNKVDSATSNIVEMGVDALTEADIAALKADAAAKASKHIASDVLPFYTAVCGDVDYLVGSKLETGKVTVKYEYTAKPLTIKIDGMADQTITIEGGKIKLFQPESTEITYQYNINGKTVTSTEHAFVDKNEIKALFATSDVLTISYVKFDRYEAQVEKAFDGCDTIIPVRNEDGTTVKLDVVVDYSKNQNLVSFAMELLAPTGNNFQYIGLNGKGFAVKSEFSAQTLIDAMLYDPTFGSEKLIALADGNGGLLMTTTIQLGMFDSETNELEIYRDVPMTMTLKNGVEPSLKKAASALKQMRSFVSFKGTEEGIMDIQLNAPEEAYAAYIAAMVASNNLGKLDMATVNNEVAYQFFCDYIYKFILDPEVTAYTYANTVNRVINQANNIVDTGYGPIDTTSEQFADYADYYETIRENIQFNVGENTDDYIIDLHTNGNQIDVVIGKLLGFDIGNYGMAIKQEDVDVKAVATVANLQKAYEAAVIDVNGNGKSNKFAYTDNLSARAAQIKGHAFVILAGTVNEPITFSQSGTVVLDLNGQMVNSSITATNGKVIIIDSNLDSTAAGSVKGAVSGNVVILAGNYSTDVKALVRDGYKQHSNGMVSNIMFHFEGDTVKSIVPHPEMFTSEDYVTTAAYMAADIAVDLLLNYYTAASLIIGDHEVLEMSFNDIVGMLTQDTVKGSVGEVIDRVLDCVNLDADNNNQGGLDALINEIMKELLNVHNIYELIFGTTGYIPTWGISSNEWEITVRHETNGDYLTADLLAKQSVATFGLRDQAVAKAKELTIDFKKAAKLAIDKFGDNFEYTLRWLDETVIEEDTFVKIDLDDITREGSTIVFGGGMDVSAGLNFAHNLHPVFKNEEVSYNHLLATLLAYGSDTIRAELAKDGLLRDLNAAMYRVMDSVTVGTFFSALEKAIESDATIADMVAKTGIEMDASYIEKLQTAYDKVKETIGNVLAKYDFASIAKKPVVNYLVGSYTYEFKADVKDHSADAYVKGYGVKMNLKKSTATLKLILADDYRIVFDNQTMTDWTDEGVAYLDDVAYTLEGNTIWLKDAPTAKFAVTYTNDDTTEKDTYEFMYVWQITPDAINPRLFHAKRVEALDNVLYFDGCSVWLGQSEVRGLRFAYNEDEILEAEDGLAKELPGAEVLSHGTYIRWTENKAGAMTDSNSHAGHDDNGFFYNTFGPEGTFETVDKTLLNKDFTARFYIKLKVDGEVVTLFSGDVVRNIGYVAEQNDEVDYSEYGPNYNRYVDELIALCKSAANG